MSPCPSAAFFHAATRHAAAQARFMAASAAMLFYVCRALIFIMHERHAAEPLRVLRSLYYIILRLGSEIYSHVIITSRLPTYRASGVTVTSYPFTSLNSEPPTQSRRQSRDTLVTRHTIVAYWISPRMRYAAGEPRPGGLPPALILHT